MSAPALDRAAARALAADLLAEPPYLTEAQVWALAEPRIMWSAGEAVSRDGRTVRRVIYLHTQEVDFQIADEVALPEFSGGDFSRFGMECRVELELVSHECGEAIYTVRLID